MNKLLLLIIMLCFQQGLYAEHPVHSHSAFVSMQTVYTCPMHPEVKSGKPGNCPKCGMKLVVQKTKATKPSTPAPAKKAPAPKAASQNAPASPAKEPVTPVSAMVYTCPMHPEVKSNKPGNCPKCGMKLVVQKSKSTKPATPVPAKKTPPAKKNNMDGMTMPAKKDTVPALTRPVSDPSGEHQNMIMPAKDSIEAMEDMDAMKTAKANLVPIKTISNNTSPRTIRYDLYIADTVVNFTGKSKRAIAVNGQIPMPTITFTQGDTAEIYVHNNLKEETSLHWHGLFLPNRYDGVPNLTQMPIKPGTTHVYKFPIIQHGTHWYHSHTRLQEQIGMYGAFIMNKRAEWDIRTLPITLSEWTDMNPKEVDRSLHAATDWFAIQKGSTQSYSEAIKGGYLKIKLANEWKRMNAMDVSDVYYDRFLINGKNQNEQPQFKAGDKVRLRLANAGASTYFWLTYSGGKITVVATDGNDVEPVEVDRLIIAVSETYDVVVTIPENKSYEFLVTAEDRTKSASLWLGTGPKVPAAPLARLKYFAGMKMMNEMMDMQGNMVQMEGMKMQNQIMDMNTVMYPEITGPENEQDTVQSEAPSPSERAGGEAKMPMDHSGHNMAGMESPSTDIITLNYNMLRDPKKTTLPPGPMRELRFDLTGNMNRYVWTLDNKTVSESDKILIKKGENLRIILFNNSMMRHPMHLHGHDFRVLNDQGENAPMKNIIDIMPMEMDTIEFAATEPGGDWFFHCHILYHMMSGMGRVFSYENSPPNPDVPDPKLAQRKLFRDDRMFHPMGQLGLESNGSDGEFMLANTRYRFSTEWRLGLKQHHGNEVETYFGRYIGRMQWWFPFVGFDYHRNTGENMSEKNMFGQTSNQDNRKAFVAGVQYNLPMQVMAEARLDSEGKMRFQLMREDIPLTPRIRLNMMGNTDKEYMGGLRYIVSKYFSLSTHYDSDMGYGGGLTLTY